MTSQYTGAEITLLCREAALQALEDNIDAPVVKKSNLIHAVGKIRNRLTEATIARYESFSSKFKKSQISSEANKTEVFRAASKDIFGFSKDSLPF